MTLNYKQVSKVLSCDEYDAYESVIDTQYFGVLSANVILKKACLNYSSQRDLLTFLGDYEFVTIVNKLNDPFNNRWLGENTGAFLTDMNMQFIKNVSVEENSVDRNSVITDNLPTNMQIINIAKTSFKYSRFLNDPYLPREKARLIYADIVQNAFGKSGKYFAVICDEQTAVGFLLFSVNEIFSCATIELFAADPNYQGKGVGNTLILAIERFVTPLGIRTIKVGTQLDNLDAVKFYTAYGFRCFECNSVYHYWPARF